MPFSVKQSVLVDEPVYAGDEREVGERQWDQYHASKLTSIKRIRGEIYAQLDKVIPLAFISHCTFNVTRQLHGKVMTR